jgi:hypothetical protein
MDLTTRVTNLLTSPTTEWPVIAAEPDDPTTLYRQYAMILAAISPVCGLLGGAVLGFHASFGHALVAAVLHYVVSLVGVYVLAIIIAKLAPSFSGRADDGEALKLAVYSATASWLGGIFLLLPFLGILSLIASLYSLYLLYLGLPPLMRAPPEKSLGYAIAVIIAAIVVSIVGAMIIGLLAAVPMAMI